HTEHHSVSAVHVGTLDGIGLLARTDHAFAVSRHGRLLPHGHRAHLSIARMARLLDGEQTAAADYRDTSHDARRTHLSNSESPELLPVRWSARHSNGEDRAGGDQPARSPARDAADR